MPSRCRVTSTEPEKGSLAECASGSSDAAKQPRSRGASARSPTRSATTSWPPGRSVDDGRALRPG
eukprot:5283960-Alexandrium_andersonii.AAC.1